MKRIASLILLVAAAGCASTPRSPKPVDMDQPRRVVGTENDVRVDAEIYGDRFAGNVPVAVKYDITNQRQSTILVADLIPDTTFDPDTATVTVNIGSEIPGMEFLPRLIPIHPGEKKSFQAAARLSFVTGPTAGPFRRPPAGLRIKLNFLGETKPFEKLIAIPERAVHDPQLANDLFTKWVEGNETVVTNSLPMHWTSEEPPPEAAPRRKPGRRTPP